MENSSFEIHEGWWAKAKRRVSPNQDARPRDTEINLLVIHNISLPPGEFGGGFIEQFFLNCLPFNAHPWFNNIRGVEVSAHCLIDREGEAIQFVPFHARAWHAGKSEWCGRERCNDFSIGIELEGSDTIAYTERQYAVLAELTLALMRAYPLLKVDNIVGHETIAPGRKTDPGPAFNWAKYKSLLDR